MRSDDTSSSETPAENESHQSDPRLASIAEVLAHLIAVLWDRLGDLLDLSAGALASLIRAGQLGYQDRPGALSKKYYENLGTRVRKMAGGTMLFKGPWASGYYLNSAILRIGAARDKLRGLLTSVDRQNELAPTPRRSLPKGEFDNLHKEYIALKHDLDGLREARRITYKQAVEGLEELVGVLKDREAELSNPSTNFPRRKSAARTRKNKPR